MAQITTYFRSGSNRPLDIEGCTDANAPIGVVIDELSWRGTDALIRAISQGVPAFIDSGAFGAFRRGRSVDFAEVLGAYREIALSLEADRRPLLRVVAPDVIGDFGATLEQLAEHRAAVLELVQLGVQVIVPLQLGDRQTAAALEALDHVLGLERSQLVAGVPCNACPMPLEQVAEIAISGFGSIHLLGIGPKNRRFDAYREILEGAEFSCDSNRIAALVGKGRRLTEHLRAAKLSGALEATVGGLLRGCDARGRLDLEFDDTELEGVDPTDDWAFSEARDQLAARAASVANAQLRSLEWAEACRAEGADGLGGAAA